MANVVVVGAQWGDEGKGKIVDWLSERADVVCRFHGGHNAGHTLVVGGEVFKLQILPSGVLRKDVLSVIGNGVVLDPWHLVEEMEALRARGVEIDPSRLIIAENVTLILPFHRELDQVREARAQSGRIGTTGRGIGPAYEDKVGRRAIRLADLADPKALADRLDEATAHHDALRAAQGLAPVDRTVLLEGLAEIGAMVLPFAAPVWKTLHELRRAGKRILFEGAQGLMLDVDFGTYPYVTSSNSVAAQAATGTGLGPDAIDCTLGVVKAYTTRVGEGPFPTELNGPVGRELGVRGKEFGTITGRQRRCGWFDAIAVRQSCAISGVTGMALTKLDVLDGLETLRICVGYVLDAKPLDHFPVRLEQQQRCAPIYLDLPGWQQPTKGVRRIEDLPTNAINYVRALETHVGCPVVALSLGPEREDTILLTDPFAA